MLTSIPEGIYDLVNLKEINLYLTRQSELMTGLETSKVWRYSTFQITG